MSVAPIRSKVRGNARVADISTFSPTGKLKSKSVGKQKPRKKFEIREAQEEHEFLCLFCLFA